MAPYRNEIELDFKNKNPKVASTLLLIYPKDGETFFCLIERQEYEGTHSNQISFPGGKNESGESMKETALRETNEEIGVDPCSIPPSVCKSICKATFQEVLLVELKVHL